MAQPPPTQEPEASTLEPLIDAYSKMRAGIVHFFISSLLLIIGGISTGTIAFLALGPRSLGALTATTTGLVALITIVIAIIILLKGILAKFVPGVKDLAKAESSFYAIDMLIRIGLTGGAVLALIWILLLLIRIFIAKTVLDILASFLLIYGIFLGFIGYIGIIALQFQLYNKEKDSLYSVAGTLFTLLLIPFLPLITRISMFIWMSPATDVLANLSFAILLLLLTGWVLFYVALGNSIRKAYSLYSF